MERTALMMSKMARMKNSKNILIKRIEYRGAIVGLNQYKSLSWRKLKNKIDPLKYSFNTLIVCEKIPPLQYMELRVEHNTRFDIDNLAGTVKVFADCLRKAGVIKDDTKAFWDYLSLSYNPDLPKKTLIFEITGEII